MRMYDIIRKKRDGGSLTPEEIRWFVRGCVEGRVPDYQAAALCMAVFFRGMTEEETAELTFAMRDSGRTLRFDRVRGIRADKHSTGGVGDKTSLVVAPIAASLGLKVAKMSGRGLGHTGGTVDKLESIRGFRADLTVSEFEDVVSRVGLAITGQTDDLVPADRILYALRDVTATVDSLPLIASSIMSKKLAAGDDCIVLDVKTGSGAFMKTEADSRRLAELMVGIGRRAGRRVRALITDMDRPLGRAVGNALEVVEAIAALNGRGPADLTDLCAALAAHMLNLAGYGPLAECEAAARRAIADGSALRAFAAMVEAQGGDPGWILHPERFPTAAHRRLVRSPFDGFIVRVNCEDYGRTALLLGAGRSRAGDAVDPAAGFVLSAVTGDFVRRGDPLATLYASDESALGPAEELLLSATVPGDRPPEPRPLILGAVE